MSYRVISGKIARYNEYIDIETVRVVIDVLVRELGLVI
jgi:hypothetical protein